MKIAKPRSPLIATFIIVFCVALMLPLIPHKNVTPRQDTLADPNNSDSNKGLTAVSVEQTLDDLFENLMTLPKESSNPIDYVYANQNIFNQILVYSNSTLLYCFKRFEAGGQTDLKGHLMMMACRTLCQREDIELTAANGQKWYDAFKANAQKLFANGYSEETQKKYPVSYLLTQMLSGQIDSSEQEIVLPDFQYQGTEYILKLVYTTELEQHENLAKSGFLVPAVHIHDASREENKLKVFATIYTNCYRLFGKELKLENGGVIPVAITYCQQEDGSWQTESYTPAHDGSYFESSIKDFCTTPVTQTTIENLADKIIKHYGNYKDLTELQNNNLAEHLQKYKQSGVSLVKE